ncbi:hypothetical protein RhiLY_05011 [Ceratobasidium sp. AG-Ba]|nr:hypothetical protein RhiLY_05011 [Ceratobasidium sp. AG-Ba]
MSRHSSVVSRHPSVSPPTSNSGQEQHSSAPPASPTSPAQPNNPSAFFNRSLVPAFGRPKSGIHGNAFDNGVNALYGGKYKESCTYLLQAAKELHQQRNAVGEAHCFRYLGKSYRSLGDYTFARSSLWAARAMYETIGPQCQKEQFRCSRYLALIEEDLGNFDIALKAYQNLLQNAERNGFGTQRAWCLGYIGHLHCKMKMPEQAEIALNAALESPLPEIQAYALEGLGNVQESWGKLTDAMNHYNASSKNIVQADILRKRTE